MLLLWAELVTNCYDSSGGPLWTLGSCRGEKAQGAHLKVKQSAKCLAANSTNLFREIVGSGASRAIEIRQKWFCSKALSWQMLRVVLKCNLHKNNGAALLHKNNATKSTALCSTRNDQSLRFSRLSRMSPRTFTKSSRTSNTTNSQWFCSGPVPVRAMYLHTSIHYNTLQCICVLTHTLWLSKHASAGQQSTPYLALLCHMCRPFYCPRTRCPERPQVLKLRSPLSSQLLP